MAIRTTVNKRQVLKDPVRETRVFKTRQQTILIMILLLAGLLLGRLFYLQIFQHARYTTLAKQNQFRVIPHPPNRGLIYDRHGVLLAQNIPIHNLDITPDKVNNLKSTLILLQQLLGITDEEIVRFHKLRKRHRISDSVPLRVNLSEADVAKFAVNQHRFPGVNIHAGLFRHYPQGELFAHLLGFVGRINSDELKNLDTSQYRATRFIGKVGIEKFYETKLHGQPGHQQVEMAASGQIVRVIKSRAPKPGEDLVLSIDSHLQKIADKALGNKRGAVVAIDPNTGEVLILVSKPSYNPNAFVQGISHQAFNQLAESKNRPLYNRAIRGQYPPASTIKVFLALQALDKQIVDPNHQVYDPGYFKLPNNKHRYRCWKRSGHGWVNILSGITVSCDTYSYELANMMGIRNIEAILRTFGFGQNTHLDMGEEVPGLVPNPEWKVATKNAPWYTGDTILSGIGQGFVLATPIQLAQATATMAARGVHYKPHLLLNNQHKPDKIVNLKHPEVWHWVINAMANVIAKPEGTGRRFGRDAPYTVAAKTGTAQVFSTKQHEYHQDHDLPEHLRDHSIFIAFAPVINPKIAVAVVVENSPLAPKVARQVIDGVLDAKKT